MFEVIWTLFEAYLFLAIGIGTGGIIIVCLFLIFKFFVDDIKEIPLYFKTYKARYKFRGKSEYEYLKYLGFELNAKDKELYSKKILSDKFLDMFSKQVIYKKGGINLKNLKVADKNHPIYTGKYQTYSVSTKKEK